jgi:hypothetical protein
VGIIVLNIGLKAEPVPGGGCAGAAPARLAKPLASPSLLLRLARLYCLMPTISLAKPL